MSSKLKLKFDSHLDYQDEAIGSIRDLFEGQGSSQSLFTVSAGAHNVKLTSTNYSNLGIGNRLDISEQELLENLQRVQLRNSIAQSTSLNGQYDFDIEMETGTGKTYVYTKAILELNKEYGFTKFIIVVPSLAIKEGVYKSLTITESHFKDLFNNVQYDYFIYNSDKLEQVRDFAINDCVSIMIINIDAFRKSFEDIEDYSKKSNIIHRPNDKLNGMKPIDLIAETNPIVIIDETQSVDTTEKSAAAIKSLNPLCVFRYSATHVRKHNLIYRLNAIDAYERKLVKGIDVAGFTTANQHNEAYIRLVSVDNKKKPITAKIEVDVASKDGVGVQRKVISVKQGDDLESKTKRSVYSNYFVEDIWCEPGNEYIEFEPVQKTIPLGTAIGDVDDLTIKRQMISKTIQEHLDKELDYNKHGIKVLSLFFIDRVAKYRDKGEKGPYAKIFEEEYARLIQKPKYKQILGSEDPTSQAESCHNGYFSVDKGGWVDSNGNTVKDDETYKLIMIDKEKLLSFSSKLRFIFSHSALAEGWDNPNVFQICTLVETKSVKDKRQKIGRGLRLCVDQSGNRIHDPNVNQLTVMANESFEDFALGLQHEYEEDSGIKFGFIEKHTFAKASTKDGNGDVKYIGEEGSKKIYQTFLDVGYINEKGRVQDKLKVAIKKGEIELPEEYKDVSGQIIETCRQVCGSLNIKNNDDKKKVSLKKEVFLGDDFKDLWEKIKFKTKYELNFDSEKLADACAEQIHNMEIKSPVLLYNKATIEIDASGVKANPSSIPIRVDNLSSGETLPDIITYLQNKTDLTRKTIVRILTDDRVNLEDFKKNPQMFMEGVSRIIIKNVRSMALKGIKYTKIGDCYAQELFESEELIGYLNKNLVETKKKGLFEYTVYDSDIEKKVALQLENMPNVKLFVKLPDWFRITTPIGDYNPDWAVLMDGVDGEHLYFVFETKGNIDNNRATEEFKIECGKRHFEALENGVRYSVKTDMNDFVTGDFYLE